ncbi:hypothetical protein ACFRQM_44380 [Streptomyces sp. NPDC056831]|uniref:hypothetical protein n=1 Tax=Streptomyces sp. NPDC056831 TaxID=3345954 RepID=UPI0036798B34
MRGGFDLSATRFRAQPTVPPPHQPPFMQNAQLDAYASVGFSFGDAGCVQLQDGGGRQREWGLPCSSEAESLGKLLTDDNAGSGPWPLRPWGSACPAPRRRPPCAGRS